MNEEKGKRIIGLDMHPDVFAAAALSADQSRQNADWVQDRMPTAGLEAWAKKQLRKEDVVVLEASGVDPAKLRAYAATGIDLISTSAAITRSPWLDLSMRFDRDS